jgi:alanyl-tRNA synthetase
MLNHSATHLLHASLKNVLGEHVIQKGSYVGYDRLRFDFSHEKNVSQQELNEIENMVNTEIRNNNPAETKLMGYEDAVSSGAVALFGEKYDEEVRVLSFGDFSIELCGGTHVGRSGDIGFFKIITESGIASGVRRIEAVTGEMAVLWAAQNQKILNNAVELLRSAPDQMLEKLQQILKQNKNLEKELAIAKQRILTGSGSEASGETSEVDGIKVFTLRIDNSDAKTLRDATDKFKDKLGNAIVVIGSVDSGKARLAVGVTKNNTDRISAGDIIKPIAAMVGGKGGGRSDFAQAGGSKTKILDEALASVHSWVAKNIDQN